MVEVADVAGPMPEEITTGSDAETLVPEAFLPVAYRDMEELDGFLEHLARRCSIRGIARCSTNCSEMRSFATEFRRAPCSRAGHHAYLGGLIEHTVAVATLARELCDLHRRLNSDLLLTAAIVHDIGRVREFSYGAEIGLTTEGSLLGHLALGQQMLAERFSGSARCWMSNGGCSCCTACFATTGRRRRRGGRFASARRWLCIG